MISFEYTAFLTTILSITMLIIVNRYVVHKYVQFFNFIVLSEAVTLTFAFEKFPYLYSSLLILSSIFFIINNQIKINTQASSFNDNFLNLKIIHPKIISLGILISTLVYEYHSDQSFNSTVFLFLILSSLFYIYGQVPQEYNFLYIFLLIFFSLIVITLFLPSLVYKVLTDSIGESISISLFDEDAIIHTFLGVPLYNLLSFFNFNVALVGQSLSFEDTHNGKWQTVFIAESCAGTSSIIIFILALISYYFASFRVIDLNLFLLTIVGIFISYLANLFRMSVIIMVGHYYGLEQMLFVHEYLGWIIFTSWMFLFWTLIDKALYNKRDRSA